MICTINRSGSIKETHEKPPLDIQGMVKTDSRDHSVLSMFSIS